MTKQPTPTTTTTLASAAALPNGTRVLNVNGGKPGSILNGYGWNPTTGEWTQYEVETLHAIEIWNRSEFLLMAEIETDAART